MKIHFLQLIKTLKTKTVTVEYIKGGRDKQFGHTYSGAFVGFIKNDSEQGLYYIQEMDMYFTRMVVDGKMKTKILSVDYESKLPKNLIDSIRNVITSKNAVLCKPEEPVKKAPIAVKKISLKETIFLNMSNKERYLVLKGSAKQSTAMA